MKKLLAVLLVFFSLLSLSSCTENSGTAEVPEDFAFSLQWGCNGDSTYDSKTGTLGKRAPEELTATYFLTEEQKAEIYHLIAAMKPEKYPDEYTPLKGQTKPARVIRLSVTYNGMTKTITCKNVPVQSDFPNGKRGKAFMRVHDRIVEILSATDEWQTFPIVLYD